MQNTFVAARSDTKPDNVTPPWEVITMTQYPLTRAWGIRFEYVGLRYVLTLTIDLTAPAIRIVLLGCSIVVGRIKAKPIITTTHIN